MPKISIVNGDAGDDQVGVNGRFISFNLAGFIHDDDIWAAHWYGTYGVVEYKTEGRSNERILSFDAFQPVIDEYERRIYEIDNPPPPSLAELKEAKIRRLNLAAQNKIVSGFESTALGSVHTYQSELEDQINLIGLVNKGSSDLFKCVDSEGVSEYREHTIQQLQMVLSTGGQFKSQILYQNDLRKKQVNDAISEDQLNEIPEVY